MQVEFTPEAKAEFESLNVQQRARIHQHLADKSAAPRPGSAHYILLHDVEFEARRARDGDVLLVTSLKRRTGASIPTSLAP